MLTFISFVLSVAGCLNWLLIGILQYDFIAGIFGFQASIFSRIIYIFFGIGGVYLVLRAIINKGTFKVFERKKKKKQEMEAQVDEARLIDQNALPNSQPQFQEDAINQNVSAKENANAETPDENEKQKFFLKDKQDDEQIYENNDNNLFDEFLKDKK